MEENEIIELEGNEPEVPLPAESDTSAENQKSTVESETPPAKVEAPKGLGSAFEQAKAKALAARQEAAKPAESEETDKTESDDEPPADDTAAADEKVPAEEESKPEEKKVSETDNPENKQTKRGENYKQVLAERDAATARISEFEQTFEKHGGLETVETAIQLFDRLASGQVMEVINELPKADRENAYRQVFEHSLADETNRINGVNSILTQEFGLAKPMPKTLIEKAFEFITLKVNEDLSDFESLIDRELEYANTPERENLRLKAELEAAKNPKSDDAKVDEPVNEAEDFVELQQRIEKSYNEFEDNLSEKIGNAKFAAFGLAPSANDTAEVKEAKELLMSSVKHNIGVEMRTAKAFEPLLKHWVENETESPWYKQAAGNYERAMTAKYEKTLKTLSRLFSATAKPPAPGRKITDLALDKTQNKLPAPKQPAKPGGFGNAFSSARKTATNS